MKKPSQKQIKEYFKNITANFSLLIEAAIWYENHDMDDWASEIIGHIEKLSNQEELDLLFHDLSNRKDDDFDNYSYQRLWWTLINQNDNHINQQMTNQSVLLPKLHQWYHELDAESETKLNLANLLNKR